MSYRQDEHFTKIFANYLLPITYYLAAVGCFCFPFILSHASFARSPQPTKSTEAFRTFTDWCLQKEKLSQQTKHTVEVLLKIAGTYDCQQADLTLSSLILLDLRFHKIRDLTPLRSLTNLTVLILGGNEIRDLTSLRSLTNLNILSLDANQIQDITPLRSLTNLTGLFLSNNQIQDITPLRSLTNLTRLHLDGNQIRDIKPLQSLANLTNLILSRNQIADPSPLKPLTKLENLGLAENPITNKICPIKPASVCLFF